MTSRDLIATCWTSGGTVKPLDDPEVSNETPLNRVAAVADTGWQGMGFAQGDLAVIRDTIGFSRVADEAHRRGLSHLEVELATDWWKDTTEVPWRANWEMLLDAAEAMEAAWIKVGTEFGRPVDDVSPFVDPLRRLADEAAARGTRIALEPLPFALIGSMPQGAELIRQVGHDAAGLCVDYWHVFRAGTSLEELKNAVPLQMIFGVEVSDADAEARGTLFEDTRDNRRYPGEGAQDVVGFIRTLDELGYEGPWGVEMLSHEHRASPLRSGLQRARDTMLACLDNAKI